MRRRPAALAAPALLTLALAGCSAGTSASPGGGTSAGPSAVLSSSVPASPSAGSSGARSSGAGSSGASSSAAVQRLTLTVSGDSVTGDTGTVPIKLGQPVELTVTSDVADEVHVHGADVGKDVPAGGTVVIDFVENAPGRFEVELEKRKRVLTRLQVS